MSFTLSNNNTRAELASIGCQLNTSPAGRWGVSTCSLCVVFSPVQTAQAAGSLGHECQMLSAVSLNTNAVWMSCIPDLLGQA